jgi:AcrR family transcriptional regulator
MSWLTDERSQLAAERILDAAGELFVSRGISDVTMGDVARAAGCSRATLYRYFADRRELHLAFIHREARQVAAAVALEVAPVPGREDRVVAAVLSAVRRVRSTPHLAAWFQTGDTGVTAQLVGASEILGALGPGVVDDPQAGRWLVRVVVSLLTMPGQDEQEERELLARFVAPVMGVSSVLSNGS